MKKHTTSGSANSGASGKLPHFTFDQLRKEHEEFEKKRQEEIDNAPKTKVYQDLLLVQTEINNSGKLQWVDSRNPTPWQNLISGIVVYNNFHKGKDFGQQYLVGALKEYDKVYQHYIDHTDTNSPLKASLDKLLSSIKSSIEQCEKLKLNK